MRLVDAIRRAKTVYLCGNGGSAANAIHMANDLVNVGVKAHALTADVATLTAIANDYSYEEVFSRQLVVFGQPGDLLIALSGSGKSENILAALRTANVRGMDTFAIIGDFNEQMTAEHLANDFIRAGADMQKAEERQLELGHEAMMELRG